MAVGLTYSFESEKPLSREEHDALIRQDYLAGVAREKEVFEKRLAEAEAREDKAEVARLKADIEVANRELGLMANDAKPSSRIRK